MLRHSQSCGRWHHRSRKGGGWLMRWHQAYVIRRLARAWGLDDTQRETLRQLIEQWSADSARTGRSLASDLFTDAGLDAQRFRAWWDERMQVGRERAMSMFEGLAAFYQGLRPEQKDRVRDFIADRGVRLNC